MNERDKDFKPGDRARLNALGRKRAPRTAFYLGTVVSISRSSVNVCFNGNKKPTRIHSSYLEAADPEPSDETAQGRKMTKKRTSNVDLCWLISEELFEPKSGRACMPLAVILDEKDGWRDAIPNRAAGIERRRSPTTYRHSAKAALGVSASVLSRGSQS